MSVACSSTWFLIVTLLAWGLVALLATVAAPQAPAHEEDRSAPTHAPRKAPRRFIVARAPRSPALRAYALAPERAASRMAAPPL